MKRRFVGPALGLFVLAVGAAIVFAMPRLPERGDAVPTAGVARGPLKVTIHATGELRAGRTMTLVTPPVGGMLRVVSMKTTGMPVKSGEVVMEFDPADQEYALEQAKSELAEAEQEIVKMKADAEVQKAQDDVAMLTARFDVRRAELEASGNELIPRGRGPEEPAVARRSEAAAGATGRRRQVAGRDQRRLARRRPGEAQQGGDGHAAGAAADREPGAARADGRHGLGQGEPRRLDDVRARHGDSRVPPGRLGVARAGRSPTSSSRARWRSAPRSPRATAPTSPSGQPATLYVDTLPDEKFVVRVGSLSGLATRAQWYESATVTRLFDVSFQFDTPDPRLKAGASARVVIEGKEIPDALHVPRQAVLEKNGKTHVFVKVGDRFEQREVKVEHLTESRAVIAGVAEGTEVALSDPTLARPASNSSSPTLPAAGTR